MQYIKVSDYKVLNSNYINGLKAHKGEKKIFWENELPLI